jgi:hypothetical protein
MESTNINQNKDHKQDLLIDVEVYLLAQSKNCSPTCQSFKCAKNAAIFRRDSTWCREGEEPCAVAKCTYSMCFKRRLLPGGVCGETVKRKTVEHDLDGDFIDDEEDNSVRMKGKNMRRFGNDKDFY